MKKFILILGIIFSIMLFTSLAGADPFSSYKGTATTSQSITMKAGTTLTVPTVTASGTVQAEQLTSTDDLTVAGDATITGAASITGGVISAGTYDGNFRFLADHGIYSTAGAGFFNMANATGIFSGPTGAYSFNGDTKVTGTKTFMVNNGAAIFGSSLAANSMVNNGTLLQTGIATFTATPVLNAGATVASGQTLTVTSADKLLVGGVIVPQEMVITVPIRKLNIVGDEINGTIFVADDAWVITSIEERHTVAEATAATATIGVMKCTTTQAPSSGTLTTTAVMTLKSTALTTVTPALAASAADYTLADGNSLAIWYKNTGAAIGEFRAGCVVIHMKRV